MTLKAKLIDALSAAWLTAGSKIAKTIAANYVNMPRTQRAMDRMNIVIQNRTFYRPFITKKDLRRPLRDARNLPGIHLDKSAQLPLLHALAPYAGEVADLPETPPDDVSFGYANGNYGHGDAELLYAMIRHFRPRRLYEIGSGHSTKIAAKAIAKNDTPCEHICVEPYEAPWLEKLDVRVIRERVETLDPSFFSALEAGDILFIDSSHIIRPQGDVLFEYLEILPRLAPGVLIHIHDIFTPFDYHERWLIDEGLLWNEQYLLEAVLSGGDYDIKLATNWLSRINPDALAAALPGFARNRNSDPSSFWIERR